MSEREIRSILARVGRELDARLRQASRKVVLPAALSAGLLMAGCPVYDGPDHDIPVMTPDSGPQPDYMAPDVPPQDVAIDTAPDLGVDAGAQPDYMAPDAGLDGGPAPHYMGPDA